MSRVKKCCNAAECEHEIGLSYDKTSGWVVSTNSRVWAKLAEEFVDDIAVVCIQKLGKNKDLIINTTNVRAARNIVSALEED